MRPIPMFTLLLSLISACGDKDAPAESGTDSDTVGETDTVPPETTLDPDTVPLAGSCPQESLWGGFELTSYVGRDSYAIIDGGIASGVVPITILTALGSDGDCQLLRRENLFCDPACSPDQTCDFDGQCIAYPASQDLGTATMSGLFEPVTMEPVEPGFKYFDTSLPFPAYEPGSVITLRTTGGAFAPLELHGVGVEPMVIPEGDLVLVRDTPIAIRWTAPSGPVRSEVHARVTVDQHGVTPVQISCVTADDGELDVPAALVTQLIDLGVTGFPNGLVQRRTVDSAPVGDGGCAELVVSAPQELSIRVDGFVPCDDPTDCPDGSTCNLTTGLCENE